MATSVPETGRSWLKQKAAGATPGCYTPIGPFLLLQNACRGWSGFSTGFLRLRISQSDVFGYVAKTQHVAESRQTTASSQSYCIAPELLRPPDTLKQSTDLLVDFTGLPDDEDLQF